MSNLTARPLVVALHGSASSARQWRALEERLSPSFDVETPDLNSYSNSDISGGLKPGLARRAAPVIAMLEARGNSAHLVGHSFGGALAIKIASMRPDLVESVTVYEPASLSLLRDAPLSADRACYGRFQRAGVQLTACLATDAPCAAMRPIVEFWNGEGAWEALDPAKKAAYGCRASSALRDFVDIGSDRTSPQEVAGIKAPVQILAGMCSTEAARRIARRVSELLPDAGYAVLNEADHMAPIDQAGRINAIISGHLTYVVDQVLAARKAA